MILLSELSRRRIRSINKLLRVGKNEVVMVIRVDKEKGYIDLSKRRVSGADIRRTDERFSKSKSVHSVLRHVSTRLRVPLASLYQRIAWPLARKYGHAYDAFTVAVLDPEPVFALLSEITAEEKAETIDFIKLRMTPQPLKIRADIQVTCFAYEGVNAVKAALLAGQALSTEAVPIKVQLIAPPLYVMLSSTPDKEEGIARLSLAIAEVKRVLDEYGGEIVIKMAPQVTTAEHDGELSRMLEGQEDDADGEEDEEEEGGEGGRKPDEEEDMSLGTADFEAAPLEDAASSAASARSAAAMLASVTAAAAAARLAIASGVGAGSGAATATTSAAAAAASAIQKSSAPDGEIEVGAAIAFTGAKKKKATKQVSREEDD
jgi:translation initiation factor 2 subunit 1